METPKEFVGCNDQIHMVCVKGRRRNKRLRLLSGGGDGTSSSSCGGGAGGGGEEFTASSSISGDIISTEEEEDMANCLILLAQGDHGHRRPTQILQESLKIERSSSVSTKRFNFDQIPKTGFYVYECKTCNRTFPSFQALGGHRASHTKPKPPITAAAAVEERPDHEPQFNKVVPNIATTSANIQIPIKAGVTNFQAHKSSGKVHECSICGLEFTSGQALGGHMRRHRAIAAVSSTQQVMAMNTEHNHNHNHNHNNSPSSADDQILKPRNILELDLNLPAPEEDLRETKFQLITATPQTYVFSGPTLVDCHY